MDKLFKLIYLILLVTINFSCVENKSTETEGMKKEISEKLTADTLKFTSGVRSIFQDSKGHYWFGSHSEGVAYFHGESVEYFTMNEGLADNQIRSIQEDKNGTIWFGTANGVSNYDGKNIRTQSSIDNLESEWTKKDGDLWFNAGTRQGVFRYDGQKLNYLPFPNPKNTTSGSVYALTSSAKGKNNMLWFGTYAGVFGYNGIEFTIINDKTLKLTEDTEKMHVRSILEDSQGRLWIGNNGIGVLLLEGNSIIHFSKEKNLIHPASKMNGDKSEAGTLEHVFAIEEDAEGNIWFGDRDTGVWKYDGTTVTNYTVDSNLESNMVWTIYKDNGNQLFFGMSGGGVYEFSGETFKKAF